VDNFPVRFGLDRVAIDGFQATGNLRQFKAEPRMQAAVPCLTRKPTHGEAVYILGCDDEGPFMSTKGRIQHIAVQAKHFFVTGIAEPDWCLTGGLVLAESDCAVLGQMVELKTSVAMGLGAFCVGFPETKSSSPDIVIADVLAQKFPMLHTYAWPVALLEEVFTHSSALGYSDIDRPFDTGNVPLAAIGDDAAKIYMHIKFRKEGVPYALWNSRFQRAQNNVRFANLAAEFGLCPYLVTGKGVVIPAGGKPYADMLEALIGAVYLEENSDVFEVFCDALRLAVGEVT